MPEHDAHHAAMHLHLAGQPALALRHKGAAFSSQSKKRVSEGLQ